MSPSEEAGRELHVLTLTPFFPSVQNEVSGCFIAEPIEQFKQYGVESSVMAASPITIREGSQVPGRRRSGCAIREFQEISGSRAPENSSMRASWDEYGNCTV